MVRAVPSGQSSHFKKLKVQLNELRENRLGINVAQKKLNSIIQTARRSSWKDAAAVISASLQLGTVSLNEFCCSTFLGCITWTLALDHLSREMPCRQVVPDSFCHTTLLNACQHGEQWKLVSSLQQANIQASIQPNIVSMTTVSRAQKKWQLALCSNLCRLQVEGDLMWYTSVLKCCADGPWKNVLSLLTEMGNTFLRFDEICLSTAMTASPWPLSTILLSQMVKSRSALVSSFTQAMNSYTSQHNWRGTLGLLGQCIDLPVPVDVFVCSAVIGSLQKEELWAVATHYLWKVSNSKLKLDAVCWSGVVAASSSEWREVVLLSSAASQQSLTFGSSGQNAVRSSLGRAHQWQRIITLTSRPDVIGYNSIIASLEKQWQRALGTVEEMCILRMKVDNIGLNALTSCETSWVQSFQILEEMQRFDVKADVISFASKMEASVKALSWKTAMESMETMQHWKIDMNQLTLTSVISSLCTLEGAWPLALQSMKWPRKEVEMDTSYYNVLMRSCSTSSQWQSVISLQPMSMDRQSFSLVLDVCKALGRWQQAVKIVKEMQLCRFAPDIVTQEMLVSSHQGSSLQQLRGVLQEVSDGAVQNLAKDRSSKAQSKPLHWYNALHYTVQQRQHGQPVGLISHTIATRSCASSLLWRMAMTVFEDAMMSDLKPDIISCGTLMGSCKKDWQRSVRLVGWAKDHNLQISSTVLVQAVSACRTLQGLQSGNTELGWSSGLRLFSELERRDAQLNGMLCEFRRTAGAWPDALETFRLIQETGGEVDALHCSSLLRSMDRRWPSAMNLFISTLQHGVKMDLVAWNAMISTLKVETSNSLSDLLLFDSSREWATALSLKNRMRWEGLHPDVITWNTLLSAASRWESILRLLMDMEQTRMAIEDVATLTVVDACAQAGQLKVGEDLMKSTLKNAPAVVRFWSMASLAVSEPIVLRNAFVDAYGELCRLGPSMPSGEVCKLWWSASMLGFQTPQLSERLSHCLTDFAAGFLARFKLDELVAMAMAAANQADFMSTSSFFREVQVELRQRIRAVERTLLDSKMQKTLQDFLGILWATSFAGELSARSLAVARSELHRLTHHIDATTVEMPKVVDRAGDFADLAPPWVMWESQDFTVLAKPPGWEVYGDTRHQLLSYIRSRCKGMVPIHRDGNHAYGFLHRLDIPSSGMILSAKTYASYYDLQLQLVSGGISRDYLVLCHGYFPKRSMIDARLNCLLDTTKASGQGKASRTFTKSMAYGTYQGSALTLLVVRIKTGRRHQIRSHFAFLQHATVSDSRYASSETFGSDLEFCNRNFIHRFQLTFASQAPTTTKPTTHVVTMALSEDLKDTLELLSCKGESKKSLKIWLSGAVQEWGQAVCCFKEGLACHSTSPLAYALCLFSHGGGMVTQPPVVPARFKSLKSVTSALSAYAKVVQWEDAAVLLKSLTSLRLQLDAICSNAACSAFKGSQWMWSLAQVSSLESLTIQPTSITYNILISKHGWRHSLKHLESLANSYLSQLRLDAVSFSSLMNSCQEQSQWVLALQGYTDLHAGGVQMNAISRTAALGLQDQWPIAVELFAELRRQSLVEGEFMCNSLLKCLDHWRSTLRVVHEMKNQRVVPGTISRTLAMSSCEESSQWLSALKLQGSAQKEGIRLNEVSYGSGISSCTKSEQWSCSLADLQQMAQQGISFSEIGCNSALMTRCQKTADPDRYDTTSWLYALAIASFMVTTKLKLGVKLKCRKGSDRLVLCDALASQHELRAVSRAICHYFCVSSS
eukprot:symbB.v1.2.010912.t1/scaffold697.1/size171729/3